MVNFVGKNSCISIRGRIYKQKIYMLKYLACKIILPLSGLLSNVNCTSHILIIKWIILNMYLKQTYQTAVQWLD